MISGSPYQYCSRCGSGLFVTVSQREYVCDDCGYRHFITSIPAACGLILDSQKRLLVLRRAHEPGLGRLGLPGGVIEPGETGEEAAARETLEETGLQLPASAFTYLVSLPNWYAFQDYLWPTIDLFYLAEVSNFGELNADATEVSEIMTLALNEVSLYDFAFESNVEAVRILQRKLSTNSIEQE